MANEEIVTPRRLETLTDGIFAFSMTLLIIFIDVPQAHHLSGPSQLHSYLSTQYPQFVSYVVTFLLLANFWVVHHQISNNIEKTNGLHLWLNIVFMLFIVLLPFTSMMLGDFPQIWGSIFLFMINLFFISSFLLIIWLYASYHKRLLKPNIDQKNIMFTTHKLFIASLVSFLGIIISFIYLPLALYVYLLIPVFFILYDTNYKKKIISIATV